MADPTPEQVEEIVLAAKGDLDSVGGAIRCTVDGLPAGLGAPDYGRNACEEEIAQDGNIIEVGFEIGLDADEYDDIYSSLGEMPKRVAEAFPDFNFYCIEQTDAYGVAANSEATMKHGEFVCVSGDSDGNFGKRVIGHVIDGNIVFTEENIDMDEVMQILFEEE